MHTPSHWNVYNVHSLPLGALENWFPLQGVCTVCTVYIRSLPLPPHNAVSLDCVFVHWLPTSRIVYCTVCTHWLPQSAHNAVSPRAVTFFHWVTLICFPTRQTHWNTNTIYKPSKWTHFPPRHAPDWLNQKSEIHLKHVHLLSQTWCKVNLCTCASFLNHIWPSWTILINLDHLGPSGTILDPLGPFWIKLDHIKPSQTILDHERPSKTLKDHVTMRDPPRPWTIWDNFGPGTTRL